MKNRLLQVFILLFSILSSCQIDKPESIDYSILNFNELFSLYINSSDTSELSLIEEFLNDSVINAEEKIFSVFEELDTIKNTVVRKIQSESPLDFYCVSERNIYAFFINQHDKILAEGKLVSNLDSLESEIKEYIVNPENKPSLPEKRVMVIDLLDTVFVCVHGFYINCQLVPDSTGSKTSWNQLRNVYLLITESYSELRDNASISIWNSKFENLTIRQKKAILEFIPLRIWIFPNRSLILPPPPPPPSEYGVLDIVESEAEIEEEILGESENN